MCFVENAQHEKIFEYNQQQVCANKAAHQLFCSSLWFCFQKLNCFLKISVRDPRKILRVCRNSILETWLSNLENWNSSLETWFLILKNFEDRGSSFGSRLSTYIWAVLYHVIHPFSTIMRNKWSICLSINLLVVQNSIKILFTDTMKMPRSNCRLLH